MFKNTTEISKNEKNILYNKFDIQYIDMEKILLLVDYALSKKYFKLADSML